jgi:hypothetical protein
MLADLEVLNCDASGRGSAGAGRGGGGAGAGRGPEGQEHAEGWYARD